MDSVVISIGGSVILSEDIDPKYYLKFAKIIEKFSKKNKIFIIVGGGKVARQYIKLGRKLGFNEKILDEFGIVITRINAKILINIIKNSNNQIPNTTDEAINMSDNIVIMGGTESGHSTDFVGAEIASKIKSKKFIIATNVDGIYDEDPNINFNAKKFKEVTPIELINKYGVLWKSAGSNVVIDGPALNIIKNNDVLTNVLNGKKLDELENCLLNKNFNGTVLKNKKRR